MHQKRGPQLREKKQMSHAGLWGIIRRALSQIRAVPGRCRKHHKTAEAATCSQKGVACCADDSTGTPEQDAPAAQRGAPRRWSITDHVMAACAMFEFKFPSLLQFCSSQDGVLRSNLKKLFGIQRVPSDTHMREELDKLHPEVLEGAFRAVLGAAQRNGVLADSVFYEGSYLFAMDGTEMFQSDRVHCPQCCAKKHKDGTITYHHNLMAGAIVCPGKRTVLPLFPEPILKQDGVIKNDCEQSAARRLLSRIQRMHPNLRLTITADAMQSTGPQIHFIQSLGYNYLLKVKLGSHPTLFREVDSLFKLEQQSNAEAAAQQSGRERLQKPKARETTSQCAQASAEPNQLDTPSTGSLSYRKNGELWDVRWVNHVPLNGSPDAPIVNYLEFQRSVDYEDPIAAGRAARAKERENQRRADWKEGKTASGEPNAEPTKAEKKWAPKSCSIVTNFEITNKNAKQLIDGARAEWKIENETFNTLKNQGYEFEHNFGHGYLHLQQVFAVLMMLTFLVDQIVAATCGLYAQARSKIGRFKTLWEHARTLLQHFAISDWRSLWAYLARSDKHALPEYQDSS